MTLLRDLIHIPERVLSGDFVINLSDSVNYPEAVLKDYVVTPQLADCFTNALDFIASALNLQESKAAYLHGSFGSGKSHFMAMLNLLLHANSAAFSIEALHPAVAKHGDMIRRNKLLMVPYHMLDARSMETKIFGDYIKYMAKHHPEGGEPAVYRADFLFRDAAMHRERLGDANFFTGLNQVAEGDDEWGTVWDVDSYDAAQRATHADPQRDKLLGDLISAYFPSYQNVRGNDPDAFVSMEDGLAALTRHASGLGYQGIVLFLDELILWLMSHRADGRRVGDEINKITKLVEFGVQRAIPIICFVARQRDLKEIVGEYLPGAEQQGIGDTLSWWNSRFHLITLEDRNLPMIAERRVLRAKTAESRQQLRDAFARNNLRKEVEDVLLTSDGERAQFERIYPFTPALLQALVALSSVLQRERTAIKVMLQLLVNRREDLHLGELIPMGDLYDAIAEEAMPFSSEMATNYKLARSLFHDKFLPLILESHELNQEGLEQLLPDDPRARNLRADLLLAKTLILAALVPEVPCFRDLDAARLSALNPGIFPSVIARRDTQTVINKLRHWGSSIGVLKIGDQANPIVSLQLAGVDTDVILDKARTHDNMGTRINLVRSMVFAEMGVEEAKLHGMQAFHFLWRGSQRELKVSLENIRSMPDSSFKNNDDWTWKLIVDFPFDEPMHSAQDDVNKVLEVQRNGLETNTAVWLPNFLSNELQQKLGDLVKLEYILQTDDHLRAHTGHLSEVDRQSAKVLLKNMRDQTRNRVLLSLRGAYSICEPPKGSLGHHLLPQQLYCFREDISLQRPVGANLREALEHLANQLLSQEFADHPQFEEEIKKATVRQLYEIARQAPESPDGRVPVEKNQRHLISAIAVPLKLASANERYYVPLDDWDRHFEKQIQRHGNVSVLDMRSFTDLPRPRGLPLELQDLLILLFIEAHNYSLKLAGQTYLHPTASWKPLPESATLHREVMPDQQEWQRAVSHANEIFGLNFSPLCTANNLIQFAQALKQQRDSFRDDCNRLVKALDVAALQLDAGSRLNRSNTAAEVARLLGQLNSTDPNRLVTVMAEVKPATSLLAMGVSLKTAGMVAGSLEHADWSILASARRLPGDFGVRMGEAFDLLLATFGNEELASPLGPQLASCRRAAARELSNSANAHLVSGAHTAEPPLAPSATSATASPGTSAPASPVATGRPGSAPAAGAVHQLSGRQLQEQLQKVLAAAPPGKQPRFSLSWTWEDENTSGDRL